VALLLYRLGRACFRRKWLVLGAWVALLILIVVLAAAFKGATNDSFSVPGTESQRALALLDQRFPGTGGATARIVFAAPPGHTLSESQYQSVIQPTVA
jgi:RND superfamily putative drug exporter